MTGYRSSPNATSESRSRHQVFRGTERFELIAPLGSGGMGVVFEAYDRDNACGVALKLLPTLNPCAATQFKNEFRSVQGIHHPNLVNLRELFEERGQLFFTMELVRGVDIVAFTHGQLRSERVLAGIADAVEPTQRALSVSLASGPPQRASSVAGLDHDRLRQAFSQLARGLQELHAHGKVHRDVKPSNVLVTDAGRTLLLDYGLLVDSRRSLSKQERWLGTVSYMSPEQAAGEALGAASDWYSMGVVLYEALTGRLPFSGSAREVLRRKQHENAPGLRGADAVPPDLAELCERLLQREPGARSSGAEILALLTYGQEARQLRAAQTAPRDLPFVGRAGELRQLASALERVDRGPLVVSVEGESGVGKTALVQAFLSQALAQRSKLVVFRGRCSERELLPFKAFDAIAEDMVRQLEEDVCLNDALDRVAMFDALDDAALIFPVLNRLSRPSSGRGFATRDALANRHIAFLGVRKLLHVLSYGLQVVLCIDDWQWVDADSIALLTAILGPPNPPRLLLLLTCRSEAARLDGLCIPERVRLDNLLEADARELALRLLGRNGHVTLAEATAREIAVESTGHPLFIAELVRQVQTPGPQLRGTPRLDETLWSRFCALEPMLRRAVELLATAGAPIPLFALRDALRHLHQPLSGSDLLHTVTRLRDENFASSDGLSGSNLIDCFHDRVASTVLSRLPDSQRRYCHESLALAFEQSVPGDLESLTLHWRSAGNGARAAHYAVLAGDRAMNTLAFERAAEFYALAVELQPSNGALARERLGEVLSHLGRGRAAADAYLAGAHSGQQERQLLLLRLAADQLFRSGYVDDAVTLIGHVFQHLGLSLPRSPRQALLWLAVLRARVRLRGLRFTRQRVEAIDARELARVDTLWSVAIGLSTVDNLRGAYIQSRHLLVALRLGEPFRVLRALAAEAGYRAASGIAERQGVARLLSSADELARELEDPYAFGFVHLARGIASFLHGDWAAARQGCEHAVTIFERRPVMASWELASARMFGLWAAFYQGDFATTRDRVPRLISEAESRGDMYAATCLGLSLCNAAWLIIDQPQEARRHLKLAEQRWSNTGVHLQHHWSTVAWVNLELYEGNARAAHERIERIQPLLRDALLLRIELVRVELTWLRGRAALAVAAADSTLRSRMLADARRCARSLGREQLPWAPAAATMLRAGVEAVDGNPMRAASLLEQGYELALRSGMRPLAFAAHHLLHPGAAEPWSDGETGRVVVRPDRWSALFAPGFA